MTPTTPSADDLTRQQLDELDTLLQRMLALPAAGDSRTPRPLPADVPPLLPADGMTLPSVPEKPADPYATAEFRARLLEHFRTARNAALAQPAGE